MIRITSKKDGFRRCGVAHPKTATEYLDGRFSAKELKILQAEPQLDVQLLAGDQSDQSGKNKRPNVGGTVALVQAALTVEELNAFAEDEERKGVLDAIVKRGAELAATKPPEE